MLLCSVRARHDALGSVAEGIGCDAVVVRRKLELSLSYAPVRWTTMACEDNVVLSENLIRRRFAS
jgi:hypothetical protein